MGYKETYEAWLANPYFDEATKDELKAIAGDDKEIKERFMQILEFGTAGLRGIIGAGTNRMNIYTVRKATQGLANYIISQKGQEKGVAIAFDSRRMSPEFADEAACCLAANGIKAYVFESLRPTPELFLCSERTGMYFRYQHYSQPQSTGVQWIQSILGRWRADHTTSRHRHYG